MHGEEHGSMGSSSEGAPDESVSQLREELSRSKEAKGELEERLQVASEVWQSEQDGLYKLIGGLNRAMDTMRSELEGRDQLQRRLEESRRYGRQLELQCEEQAAQYESEIKRLKSRVAELEQQAIELLERSTNTHRGVQAVEDRMAREAETHRRKVEIEADRELKASQIRWTKERRLLKREIQRLKSEGAAPSARSSLRDRLFGADPKG